MHIFKLINISFASWLILNKLLPAYIVPSVVFTFQPSRILRQGRYASLPFDQAKVLLSVPQPGQAVVSGHRTDPHVLPETHRQGTRHRLCASCKYEQRSVAKLPG